MAKVLVVDDSELIRSELAEILEQSGHQVVIGTDGTHGIEMAKSAPDLDLIITDYNMPGVDGISMLMRIKEEIPQLAATPGVMVTTEVSKELKEQAKNTGILMWVVKPYNREQLSQAFSLLFEKIAK